MSISAKMKVEKRSGEAAILINQRMNKELEILIDSKRDLAMTFRYIPPCPEGFLMGDREETDSQPVHRVSITQGFWLGETLVTQAQFAAWTELPVYEEWFEENKEKLYDDDRHSFSFDHDVPEKFPAGNISWYEARGFCEWLNANGSPNGEGTVMLPTEAQWEYACRAGSRTDYYTGDGEAALDEAGRYDENSEGKTQPVMTRKANDFGLYDMHGNLWEWCRDAWDGEAYAKRSRLAVDPVVESSEAETPQSRRVLRGGSWYDSAALCRSACRRRLSAGVRYWYYGFRVGLFPGSGGT